MGTGGVGGLLALELDSDFFGGAGAACDFGSVGQSGPVVAPLAFGGGSPHAGSPRRGLGAMAKDTHSHSQFAQGEP